LPAFIHRDVGKPLAAETFREGKRGTGAAPFGATFQYE
jgi:hypothetical protein